MSDNFQTAFPEDTQSEDETSVNPFRVGEVMCYYGCGKPGQYFGTGPMGGEFPRCSKRISDCPARGGVAIRAARKAGRLGGGRRRG